MSDLRYELEVQLKDGKYPYFNDKSLNITYIGAREGKSRIIYVSGRLVKTADDGKEIVEFERVSPIALKLENAKMVKTEKGTLVIKYEEGSTLYVIEIPSGFRGGVDTKISGECVETVVLRSPAGAIGMVDHVWCNGNAEIQYKISGRTRTAGYGSLEKYFGESLSGKIVIKDGKVEIIHDEELDRLLS
jgi:hypothetical protein